MTFYLKEEFLSFDHFDIWDEQDQLVYSADREFFTFGKKLNVEDYTIICICPYILCTCKNRGCTD